MKKKIIGCLSLAFLHAGHATAAEPATPPAADIQSPGPENWEFAVTPYFWAAGLSGKTSQFRSPVINIDASFDKLFQNLDFGAMLMGEARKGRYSIFGDLLYTKIGSQGSLPRGILANDADVKSSTFAGFAGLSYSVHETSTTRLEVAAGVRVWSVDTKITLNGGALNGVSRSDGASWVDALVGVRGNYAFSPKLYATGWGLIGAGGANIDWDVGAGLGYQFTKNISGVLGYRALGVDYKSGGFLFDVVQQGPMAGLTIRF